MFRFFTKITHLEYATWFASRLAIDHGEAVVENFYEERREEERRQCCSHVPWAWCEEWGRYMDLSVAIGKSRSHVRIVEYNYIPY